jgi:hypothetical protein
VPLGPQLARGQCQGAARKGFLNLVDGGQCMASLAGAPGVDAKSCKIICLVDKVLAYGWALG